MASALEEVQAILSGKALVDNKIYVTSGGLYQVVLPGPNQLGWPAYLWNEFKDLLWYLTTSSKAATGYPLSITARVYLWTGVLGLVAAGWWLARKYKLI